MTDYECQAADRYIKAYLERDLIFDGTKTVTQLMFVAYEEAARVHNAELKTFVNRMQKLLGNLRWARLNQQTDLTPIIQDFEQVLSGYPQHLTNV